MRYDMHSHTRASDGVLQPAELVRWAAELGLSGIAITDHDTVDGVAEAVEAGREHGIEVIPGIELSIQEADEDVHMLGYWIDYENQELVDTLSEIAEMRVRRAEKMIELLGGLGMPLDMEEVTKLAGEGKVGRPHVAKALVARGYVRSLHAAFDLYIGNDGPANVPKSLMDPERGMALLQRFGAAPVFAHPILVDWRKVLDIFLELGLVGLEVDHPSQGLEERAMLRALCDEHGLVATGGSDFHEAGHHRKILGSHGISGEVLAELRGRRPALA